MATRGTPLARRFAVLGLAIFATFLVVDRVAVAQDASAKLEEGLKLLRAGDEASVKEAIKVLKQAIAMDPSQADAAAALGRAEWQALINLMASGDEGANVARALMDVATPRLPDKAFNEAEMKKLVETAVTADEYGDRFDASISLARVYGEFAVPLLLPYLKSSNTDYKINAHVTLQNRIGRDAVPPLNEAVLSADPAIRFMVAGELGTIGDERSLAALSEAQTDDDPNVREQAGKAFAALSAKFPEAADLSTSDLYLRLARLYYSGDYRVRSYADKPIVVWTWNDGLKHAPVPKHLYLLKLAEEACYDALRVDPMNAPARALLARVLASEKVAATTVAAMAEDDEMAQSFAASLADADGTVAAMGWETVDQALADALDEHDHSAAAALLGGMPWIYGGADFTVDSAVVRATTNESAGVRLAAAEAVLRFNGIRRITAFPDPDGFIGLVARSVGEVIPRHVLVVDSDDERRNKMLTALNEAKYIAFAARRGSGGVVRALRYGALDLIVLSTDLDDMAALGFINKIRGEDRTKDIPLVVVGSASEVTDDEWRNLYKDKAAALAGIPDEPGLAPEEFVGAVKSSFGGDDPGATARYARSAAVLGALAGTDTGNALFNWNALTPTLTELLTSDVPDDPPVRLHAVMALGNLQDAGAVGPLVAFFGSADDAALQAAAGMAIASTLHANALPMSDGDFDTILKGTGSDDMNVRKAAFAALGSAQLTPEQVVKMAGATRPAIPSPGG